MVKHFGGSRPLRILLVFDFKQRARADLFYEFQFQLMHGAVRGGHAAFIFSDRDMARYATPFRTKRLGAARMARALEETVRNIGPDVVLFGHADLLAPEDFDRLRRARPGVRLAQINVDSPRRGAVRGLAARAPHMDSSFITCADLDEAAPLFDGVRSAVRFMPNPVDAAIDTGRADERAQSQLDRDAAFFGSVCVDRPAQLAELRRRLPSGVRFEAFGDAARTARVVGAAYLDALAGTGMSPSLQPDSSVREPCLYGSTRIAQLLGSGVLACAHESTGLDVIYEEGIVLYRSIAELAELLERHWRDDPERRRRAAIGRRLAHGRTSAERVMEYILRATYGEDLSGYEWPTDPLR